MRITGLGDLFPAAETPMRAGTTPAVASASCVAANGVWDATTNACQLPVVADLPSWCNVVPFATSLFSECKLPTATDLANISAYTAYQTGMMNNNPADATAAMATATAQANQEYTDNTDCSYQAAIDSPVMSQILGPDLTCSLSDPFNTSGWMIYAAVAFGAYLLLTRTR